MNVLHGAFAIVSRSPHDPDDEIGRFVPGGGIDVDRAVAAATSAVREWSRLPAAQRGDALRRAADRLAARADELATLVTREVGKPTGEARAEVARAVAIVRYHAGATLDPDDSYPPSDGRSLLVTRRVPRGVVGAITPWNFPLAIPAWKLAPALAHGNACVWKPSELAPACAETLADALAAELPDGLLAVVHGRGDTGAAIAAHPGIAAVSFTGSERAGRSVAQELAARGAPAQCEMGGQNASIVLADADIGPSARTIALAAMGYAGQKCTATSRVVAEAAIADELRVALCEAVAALVVEDPFDEACQVGPLISEEARERASAAVDRALAAGGELVCGGLTCECTGHYLSPTLIAVDDPSAEIAQEEVFAPVCALLTAGDADEAAAVANGVRYGLSNAIFTRDLERALVLSRELESGLVRVNAPTSGVDVHAPFGGDKASGLGPREQGRAAREFYTSVRTVLISPAVA
jgi:acyl-CoA reductase-like NAD-dependent aldehyde dehydrogenase